MTKDDKFMICDAGGQTVDLAVFESTEHGITTITIAFVDVSLPRMMVKKKCGSVFLDLRMKHLLLYICFGADEESLGNNEPERRLEALISPLIEQFISIKISTRLLLLSFSNCLPFIDNFWSSF